MSVNAPETEATIAVVDDPLMTMEQAAAYLAIPPATLYGWRTRRPGFGPAGVKISGNLRYRKSDLNAWIEKHVERHDTPEADHVPPGLAAVPSEEPRPEKGSGRGEAPASNKIPSITRKSRPRRR